jgi:hypothetical protein
VQHCSSRFWHGEQQINFSLRKAKKFDWKLNVIGS